jgi:hypothetical protein
MPIPHSDSINALRLAENHFLEVLLSRFDLRREVNRAHLKVSFDDETPACWNRAGREDLKKYLFENTEKIAGYQEQLDNLLLDERLDRFEFNDPDFVFRWASAGALPIVRLGNEEYYCLFYREIRPIGWNIANGACDTSSELLDPLQTLERELCEELIILDPKKRDWYVLERGDPDSLDRPEFRAVRLILEDLKRKRIWDRGAGVHQLETALKWFNGPDIATINGPDKVHHTVAGCYLNINAEDFGIELDRVVKINVSEDALIFDGEILNGKLLNRLVGLFRTSRLNREFGADAGCKTDRLIPDKYFYEGVLHDGAVFEYLMGGDFLECGESVSDGDFIAHIGETGIRSPEDIRAWKAEPAKFKLCPVTRRLLQRFARSIPKEQTTAEPLEKTAAEPCEVFVSFGQGDEDLARRVADFIEHRCHKSVFYYPRDQSDYDFSRTIDNALESAQCIVAVGSSLEHLTRRWPEYEYRTFHIDVRSDKKPNGKLLALVMGIDPRDLPLPLRRFQVRSCANELGLPKALEELLPYLTGLRPWKTQPEGVEDFDPRTKD